MDIFVYLDVESEICERETDGFALKEYVIEEEKLSPDNVVVVTDSPDGATKWADYAVIGLEHSCRISKVAYVTDRLSNIDKEFVKEVYCRRFGLPLTICETERLVIREMTMEDVRDICKLYDDAENVQYIAPISDYEEECNKAQAYIDNMYRVYGYGLWVIVNKSNGKIIGRAGIEHRELFGETCHEIAYLIEKDYQGQGLGKEAAETVLGFAKNYGIESLIAYINVKNTPSINLAVRLGAKCDKVINDGANDYYLFRF